MFLDVPPPHLHCSTICIISGTATAVPCAHLPLTSAGSIQLLAHNPGVLLVPPIVTDGREAAVHADLQATSVPIASSKQPGLTFFTGEAMGCKYGTDLWLILVWASTTISEEDFCQVVWVWHLQGFRISTNMLGCALN